MQKYLIIKKVNSNTTVSLKMNIKNWKTPWNVSRERRLYFHSTFTFLIYIGSAFFFFRGSTLYYIIAAHNSTKETHQLHTILSGYFYFILMMTDDKCMSLNWIQNALSSQNVVDIILLIWLWLDFDEMRWCFRYGMEWYWRKQFIFVSEKMNWYSDIIHILCFW